VFAVAFGGTARRVALGLRPVPLLPPLGIALAEHRGRRRGRSALCADFGAARFGGGGLQFGEDICMEARYVFTDPCSDFLRSLS